MPIKTSLRKTNSARFPDAPLSFRLVKKTLEKALEISSTSLSLTLSHSFSLYLFLSLSLSLSFFLSLSHTHIHTQKHTYTLYSGSMRAGDWRAERDWQHARATGAQTSPSPRFITRPIESRVCVVS